MDKADNPTQEGLLIAALYLSKRGWAKEWRRTLNRQVYGAFQREEFEEKERQCDQLEESAEGYLSSEFERLRHEETPDAKETLAAILEKLGARNDLGFFAKQIVGHIKTYLGLY